MQTFLPYKSFKESAACLDIKRLGKQRSECLIIIKCLLVEPTKWRNHPACKMWERHKLALKYYAYAICDEWIARGYKDTCRNKIERMYNQYCCKLDVPLETCINVDWLTDEFCNAHRSNLLRKKPEYYSQFNWNVPNDLPYIWPTKDSK